MANTGLRYETFTVAGEAGTLDERGAAFIRAIDHGFLEPVRDEALTIRQLDRFRAENTLLTSVHDDAASELAAPGPIATFGDFLGTVSVGGRLLPTQMITEVSVHATHRRRGILTKMMTAALDRAKTDGIALAALTASEGGIYGRFGFGVSAFSQSVTIEAKRGLHVRTDVAQALAASGIRVVNASWDGLGSLYPDLFTAFQIRTPGQTGATHAYRRRAFGDANPWALAGHERAWRALLAINADGTPVGYAITTPETYDGGTYLEVHDLGATSPQAELVLWEHLAATDLVNELRCKEVATDFALPATLIDPRQVRFGGRHDHLWLRILDVAAAFEARGLRTDGAVTLDVEDRLGHISGAWTIEQHGTETRIRVGEGADVKATLTAETLGSLYLGTFRVRDLAVSGRLTTNDADTLSRLFDTTTAPLNTYTF